MPNPVIRLSKSKFMSGLQCHKRLWWEIHDADAPELEVDAAQQFLFDQGHHVGRVAQTYVPDGVLIDVPYRERERRLRATAEALKAGARVLYEAAFEHDNVLVVADIIERDRKGWKLIEVKSSTKVKPEHLPDVAIQAHVLRGAGLDVRRTELMHLNRECRYPDLPSLFEREDCTPEMEVLLEDVPDDVRAQLRALNGPLPKVATGDHCYEPYECPFIGRCWPDPPPHAIETLYRLGAAQRDRYESRGYRTILDLPPDEKLTALQERQRRAVRKKGLIVESGLSAALKQLKGPLAFLDFETVALAIPVWDGCRPYDQVPVQLSVHRQTSKGQIAHHEWLAEGPDDPRESIARKLIEFTQGARSVLAYNAPFEKRCIQELREHLPRLAAQLRDIEGRLVDLLPLVRDNIYHPGFKGSFALKSVVPALVPNLSYEGLEIAEGGEASRMLFVLLFKSDELNKGDRARLRRSLLEYCALDTQALVKLYEALVRLA